MFLSNRYRPNKWPFYVLGCVEFPVTVALLALFGIAAPNTYRTKLWQDGADNGFNSNPNAALYAAANYRPYTTPKPWSAFGTDYNIVIIVLSTFVMLVKGVMYILHVFPPFLSILIHGLLVVLFAVSMDYQAASDTTDPRHPQHGAPWYITKSCSVASNKNNVHYCQQAKAAFACSCLILSIFVFQILLGVYSCFPTKQQKAEHAEKRATKGARAVTFEESAPQDYEWPQTACDLKDPVPRTPGSTLAIKSPALNPMTPRTLAFNKLGGTKDLPLRNHFSTPNAPKSPTYALQSPVFGRSSPLSPRVHPEDDEDEEMGGPAPAPTMYFPPPPKIASK